MATIASDTFTEASDTPLASHTSDSGHSWAAQNDFDYGAYRNSATVNAARDTLTNSAGDVGFAYIDVDPGTADYAAEIDYIANSTVNFIQALLLARAQPDGEAGSSASHAAYAAEIDINSDVVVLWVNSGAGFTQLDSQPFSVVAGNTYRLRLECNGTTIKAIADPGGANETIAQATDSTITDRGRAGVAMRGLNSSDLEFDNFLVEDLGGGVTFPVVEERLEQGFAVAGTTHDVDLPVSVAAGELLLLFVVKSEIGDISTPWTELATEHEPPQFAQTSVFARVADGTEGGGTVTVTLADSDTGAAQLYRISGWWGALTGVDVSTATAEGTSADVPSLTPSWGSADNLWVAALGAADDDVAVTGYPTNYTSGSDVVSGGGENAGATMASAWRTLEAASEDPDAFALASSESCVTMLVAVRPPGLRSTRTLLGVGM